MKLPLFLLLFIFSTLSASHVQIQKPFKVAGIFPSTGPSADFYCILKSVFEDFKNPILKISLDTFDNQNDLIKTKEIVEKIIREKYDFVIGTRDSSEALVAASLLDQAGVPFLVPFASHPDIVNGKEHVFRLMSSSARYAKLLTDFTKIELKPRKVIIINDKNSPYSTYYTNKFYELLSGYPTDITRMTIDDTYSDYKGMALKIASEGPNLIYAPLNLNKMVQFLFSLANYPYPLIILSSGNINQGREIIRNIQLPPKVIIYYNGVWSERLSGPYKSSFYSALNLKCKSFSENLRTVAAFDAAYLLLQTLEQSPHSRGLQLMKRLKAQKYQGLMGEVNVDPQGNTIRPLNLFKIQNKEISFYRSYQ